MSRRMILRYCCARRRSPRCRSGHDGDLFERTRGQLEEAAVCEGRIVDSFVGGRERKDGTDRARAVGRLIRPLVEANPTRDLLTCRVEGAREEAVTRVVLTADIQELQAAGGTGGERRELS